MVEFISYDGKWPCLCYGNLIIKVDDVYYTLRNVLVSGGRICGGPHTDWDMWSEQGPWKVDLEEYPELESYKEEITRVVNENVPQGCCGGCI